MKSIKAAPNAPAKVKRRVVADLREFPLPLDQVVPSVQAVHDRLGLEIARGCTRGCRFCQAGYIYRPVRGARRLRLGGGGAARHRAHRFR